MNAGTVVFVVLIALVVAAGVAMGWRDWKRGPVMIGGFPAPPGLEHVAIQTMMEREKEEAAARLLAQVEAMTQEIAKIGVTAADAQRGFDAMAKLLVEAKENEVNPPMVYHPEKGADDGGS